jgi:hypothetical protein
MRFRAVMMTSFSFILGVYPLVVAAGAAEISRHGVGTPVFAGMIAASAVGKAREMKKGRRGGRAPAPPGRSRLPGRGAARLLRYL